MRFALSLFVAAAIGISTAAPAAPSRTPPLTPDASAAAATVDAFHAALRRGDAQSAAALLADDALIFEEGGAERSKAEYAAHHLPADAAFSRVVASTVAHRSGGADGALAWIATEGRMRGTYKGKAVDRVTTETVILRHVAGTWKITHIHWSSGAAS